MKITLLPLPGAVWRLRPLIVAALMALTLTGLGTSGRAQSFSSGSTGADGALNFIAAGKMTAPRESPTVTLLPNGKVLVAGGWGGSLGTLKTAELYDPTTRLFSGTGSMSAGRYYHTATLLPNGKVLIAGGYNGSTSTNGVELYDPSSGAFLPVGSLSTPRHSHTATLLPSGKVLIAGGHSGSAHLSSAELYDPETGIFTATGSMTTPRHWHTATLLADGRVLLAGGYYANNSNNNTADIYDPAAGSATRVLAPMVNPRAQHSAVLLPSGRVLITGGYNYGTGSALSAAEVFDAMTGLFIATGDLSSRRYSHTATLLASGLALVTGGTNGSICVNSADIYDERAASFKATGGMVTGRCGHKATPLSDGAVLVVGGNGPVNTTEIYEPSTGLFNTVLFDPRSFAPRLDPEGDNVYNFTTINIAAGTTVKLNGPSLGMRPVAWLASGAVQIDGTLDLSGAPGAPVQSPCIKRVASVPGAGGFPGGLGGTKVATTPGPGLSPGQPGSGPGGGGITDVNSYRSGAGGGYASAGGWTNSAHTNGGVAYGNGFLAPLVGGSGGGGGTADPTWGADICAGGGGAGGGAVVIASSDSITVRGSIVSDGGAGGTNSPDYNRVGYGGGGSGGAIYLQAPIVAGGGSLYARGGSAPTVTGSANGSGASGRIRIEALTQSLTGSISPTAVFASPFQVALPTQQPTVRVATVAGVAVPENPTGSFEVPDVTIDGSTVTLEIEAHNIPLGTLVKVYVSSESGPDQVIDSTPLQGTIDNSTATALVTLPRGMSRGYPRAVWR